MKQVYQFIRTLKLQIHSSTSRYAFDAFVTTPGFPILLALIVLLATPFLLGQKYLDTNRMMISVYTLLVIGVFWKFIRYIRQKP
jgi:hypothetical protein